MEGRIVDTCTTKSGKEIVIRLPKAEDVEEALSLINALVLEDTYIASTHQYSLEEEQKYIAGLLENITLQKEVHLFAFSEGRLIGSCAVAKGPNRHEHIGRLGIILAKDFRGEGLGKKLIELLIDEAQKIGISVVELYVYGENTPAIALYKSLGFQEAGRIAKIVAYKERLIDEVWMYKKLVLD